MSLFYKYKIDGMFKTPPEVAGAVCQALSETPDGLTPKQLVDISRPEEAPLHQEFEWDDDIAAEKYRETQAKKIIRNIIIVDSDIDAERSLNIVIDNKCTDRGFVSNGEGTHQYVPLYAALSNEEWRANLLESAKRDMKSFTTKYKRLNELANIIDDMNKFLGA